MPSTSKKQADFMRAVAHSPEFAKKSGVPQSVGKEFSNADKNRKFSKGGYMKKGYAGGGMTMVNKGGKMVPDFAADGKGKMAKGGAAKKMAMGGMAYAKGGSAGTTKMGTVKTAAPSRDGVASKGKTKGTMVKMARGGKTC